MATVGHLPLIVIVGPTASGKTALAIEISQKYNGEIICADSRTIYKGMDIGTAKPNSEERALVPHWGLDLALPDEPYSAALFQRYAVQKIAEIRQRGRVPLLVGGTGLYIDGVVFDYQFGPPANKTIRTELEARTIESLMEYCYKNNIILPENKKNKRYIIRAIEQQSITTTSRRKPIDSCVVVGLATDKDVLRTRIAARAEQLFNNGVVQEATILGKKYGWQSEAMTGNIYPIVHSYLENEITLMHAVEQFTTLDWRLAKRQMTWFRRNPYVEWCTSTEAVACIDRLLAPEQPL